MLHILHQRLWSIETSPFAHELVRLGVPHRFLISVIPIRYKTELQRFLRVYPSLTWNTLRLGTRSLFRSKPPPAAILVSTDIEAFVVGLLRWLSRRSTIVVMQTLIVRPRQSPGLNVMYIAYWRAITGLIDLAICHSQSEIEAYGKLFPRARDKFVCIPFGLSVNPIAAPQEPGLEPLPVIVTAGRSNRGYAMLVRAIEGLPCRLRIICDLPGPVEHITPSDQVEILDNCFEQDYMRILGSAAFVVVPLTVDDVSAGQMVFLQAAGLGKAVVMTKTSTTTDYATDDVEALLIGLGSQDDMRNAITRLLDSPGLVHRLGAAAKARFERDHSTEAYVRKLVQEIGVRVNDP